MTTAPIPPDAPQPKRRRWLQFSLRTLLLVMIPIAYLAVWIGTWLRGHYLAGQREQKTIAWVEARGGGVTYDEKASQRDWRRQWLGKWYLPCVKAVELRLEDNAELVPLAQLDQLEQVEIVSLHVPDLTPLAGLENLRKLQIVVGDLVYSHHNMPGQPSLDLSPLARLPRLEQLEVAGQELNSLAPLASVEELESLALFYCEELTDLSPLAGLGNLERLRLGTTRVLDLSPLTGHQRLKELFLEGDYHLTDLTPLAGFPNLCRLEIAGSHLSENDLQTLREALPLCTIEKISL